MVEPQILGEPVDRAGKLELEGEPEVTNRILPDADGVVTLSAERAELRGGLKLEKTIVRDDQAAVGIGDEETVYNIGYWLKPEAEVKWQVRVVPGQTYRVRLLHGNKPGTEGGRFTLAFGDQTLTGGIPGHTGGWQEYREMVPDFPGANRLNLQCFQDYLFPRYFPEVPEFRKTRIQ